MRRARCVKWLEPAEALHERLCSKDMLCKQPGERRIQRRLQTPRLLHRRCEPLQVAPLKGIARPDRTPPTTFGLRPSPFALRRSASGPRPPVSGFRPPTSGSVSDEPSQKAKGQRAKGPKGPRAQGPKGQRAKGPRVKGPKAPKGQRPQRAKGPKGPKAPKNESRW